MIGESGADLCCEVFRCSEQEGAVARSWIESGVAQGTCGHLHEFFHHWAEFQCPAGRFEPMRFADEEWIVEQIAQPCEIVADGRLAQGKSMRRLAAVACSQKLPEYKQEAAIQLSDIIDSDIRH